MIVVIKTSSRLISVSNYRDKWQEKICVHKKYTILVDISDDEAANEIEDTLEGVTQKDMP